MSPSRKTSENVPRTNAPLHIPSSHSHISHCRLNHPLHSVTPSLSPLPRPPLSLCPLGWGHMVGTACSTSCVQRADRNAFAARRALSRCFFCLLYNRNNLNCLAFLLPSHPCTLLILFAPSSYLSCSFPPLTLSLSSFSLSPVQTCSQQPGLYRGSAGQWALR